MHHTRMITTTHMGVTPGSTSQLDVLAIIIVMAGMEQAESGVCCHRQHSKGESTSIIFDSPLKFLKIY
jgi:hypothetical protein